ncbi:hypothetical protein ACIG5C_30175 [Streptomyces werraensis]|uniref:hypothetical protein n=1 Tax=Streptomyces werraensis TaxID=68284 RepID=UPI0037D9172D
MDVAECEVERAEEAVGEAGGEVFDGEGRGGEALAFGVEPVEGGETQVRVPASTT